MEPGSHLKSLLQTQLASDASAARYLPYCLSTLTAESLLPSSHLTKWSTRIHSLLHSKEPSARWAGLCLAHKSATLSRGLMIDVAASWITAVLPMLSRSEPLPVLKAAIRLLRTTLTTAIDIPEFYRQVCVPNAIKFTSAVASLVENNSDTQLCALCLDTLTQIITLYPSAHRASSASLSNLSLCYLNGSPTGLSDKEKVAAASRLYAVLPLIGGKVGAINLWRKSVDETLAFGWSAFHSLRTTFAIAKGFDRPPLGEDPQVGVPANLDRLRCSIATLQSLLRTAIQRPVQVPVGSVIKFVSTLLTCSAEGKVDGFIDPLIHGMEIAVVPHMWTLGCTLLVDLTQHFPSHLNPHSGQLLSVLAFHLDQKLHSQQRLQFLRAVESLLKQCHASESSILPGRLVKAIMPSITSLLSSPSSGNVAKGETTTSKERNGKKRARNYEGDEVFRATRGCLFPTADDREVLLLSIKSVQLLFKNPNLSPTLQSAIARIFISILLFLPKIPASTLSDDTGFLERVKNEVRRFAFDIASGTTSVMGKALPFIIEETNASSSSEMLGGISLLLHPRLPPLVRSMPHVEALALWKAEESQDEAETLSRMMASGPGAEKIDILGDVVMEDDQIQTDSPAEVHERILPTVPKSPMPDERLTKSTVPPPSQSIIYDGTHGSPSSQPSLAEEIGEDLAVKPLSGPTFRTVTNTDTMAVGVSQSTLAVFVPDDEDGNEEMPEINMESDSETDSSS